MTRITKIGANDTLDVDEKSLITGEYLNSEQTKRAAHVRDQKTTDKLDEVIDAIVTGEVGYVDYATPHNEVGVVVSGLETTLLSYTISSSTGMELLSGLASGDNIGKYRLKINGVTKQTKRSWWGDFNVDFNMKAIELAENDVITITVINDGEDNVAFEASLIGGIK